MLTKQEIEMLDELQYYDTIPEENIKLIKDILARESNSSNISGFVKGETYIYTEWDENKNSCEGVFIEEVILEEGVIGYKFKHKNGIATFVTIYPGKLTLKEDGE